MMKPDAARCENKEYPNLHRILPLSSPSCCGGHIFLIAASSLYFMNMILYSSDSRDIIGL